MIVASADRDGGRWAIAGLDFECVRPRAQVQRFFHPIGAFALARPGDGQASKFAFHFTDDRLDAEVGDAADVAIVILGDEQVSVGGDGDGPSAR